MSTIAGHDFGETSTGRRCTKLSYTALPCDMPWLHVRSARKEDISHQGFAHQGALNEKEYNEIREEKQKEETDLWLAIADAASAGSR